MQEHAQSNHQQLPDMPLRNTNLDLPSTIFSRRPISFFPFPFSHYTMGKGKNHDRKANPGFGKVKSKTGTSTGEFTLKRVKGQFRTSPPLFFLHHFHTDTHPPPGENFYRDAKSASRVKMLNGGKAVRDRDGKIVEAAAFQKGEKEAEPGRVKPDRRWFGKQPFILFNIKVR